MNANSAIARFAIVASPRTARRSSRCSRSPTYSLPAGHSRPHDERGGESLPAEGRNTAGTLINDENPAPPSIHCEKVTLLRGSLSKTAEVGFCSIQRAALLQRLEPRQKRSAPP